jgi:DUF1009 family protein
VTFAPQDLPAHIEHIEARIEKLGALFKALKAAGVTRVSFAGAMARPNISLSKLDRHAMRLAMKFAKGDDAILREVLTLFGEQGFDVASASDIDPALVLAPKAHWGVKASKIDLSDAARALEIIQTLAPLDVGQGAVVAGGLSLGIETLQGTDAMLGFVAQTPDHLRRSAGVLVKCPKAGQDLRIDMPTIGLRTVEAAITAGLSGIAVPAGQVLVLEQSAVKRRLEEAGLFLRSL